MSYDGLIKYEDLEIVFEYGWDRHDCCLKLEGNWVAYINNDEVLIQDAELSQEIEEEVQRFISYKNNDIGTDYKQEPYTGDEYE